jgi:hypothetical protein
MLDEEAATPNPYAALLNDPDPSRAIGAMRIMMESGDPELIDMAVEFGLLSADPAVQRAALESYLATGPMILIAFDGSVTNGNTFITWTTLTLHGTVDTDRMGFVRLRVGSYDERQMCFTFDADDACMLTLNANGVFLAAPKVNGRFALSDEGHLVGTVAMQNVREPIPTTIRLLD